MKPIEIKTTAILIISHIALMLTAGITLIYMFDFPDILREDMETTLNLFYKNRAFTVPAYYLFTLTGITFMLLVLLTYKTLDFSASTPGFLAVFFGVLFGLTSSLGFIRWPFLMQYLGELMQNDGNGVDIETIRVIYDSFHIYAGVSVGENFAFWFEFLWMFLFSTALLSKKEFFPRYMGRIGQILGIGMLCYSLEQFGGVFSFLGPLNMVVHTAQLAWLLGVAFCMFNINNSNKGKMTLTQKISSTGLFIILLVVSFI